MKFQPATLKGRAARVYSVAFSRDSKTLASGSNAQALTRPLKVGAVSGTDASKSSTEGADRQRLKSRDSSAEAGLHK